MKNVIHIFGASGSGTSTFARKICGEFGYYFMDTDDYFWLPTDPKYTRKRPGGERIEMMKADIEKADNVVISGSLVGWGDELIPLFILAIRLQTDTEIRIQRLKERESKKFGERIEAGGDMYENHLKFIEWARGYDTGGLDTRSRARHDKWQELLSCRVLLLDGADSLEDNFLRVRKYLLPVNQRIHDTALYEDIPDPAGRLQREMEVYRLLKRLAIPFKRLDHEPMATLEACRGVDKILGIHMCKNLFLCNTQKTDFYLLMMPGEKKFRTKEISKQINSARLSFAPEEFLEEYLHISPGAVSVMGLMNDRDNKVRLLVDEEILREEFLGCHPCVNTASLKLRSLDVFDTFLREVHHEMTVVHLSWDGSN